MQTHIFCRAVLHSKCIILPRQSRDKHRESTQKKRYAFSCSHSLNAIAQLQGQKRQQGQQGQQQGQLASEEAGGGGRPSLGEWFAPFHESTPKFFGGDPGIYRENAFGPFLIKIFPVTTDQFTIP
jgi:hypothetical protein